MGTSLVSRRLFGGFGAGRGGAGFLGSRCEIGLNGGLGRACDGCGCNGRDRHGGRTFHDNRGCDLRFGGYRGLRQFEAGVFDRAVLYGAVLYGAILSGAILYGAILLGTLWLRPLKRGAVGL